MPQIIPIRDLKNTSEISRKCHSVDEPVFVTKNGYGDMVIMSIETYQKMAHMNDTSEKPAHGGSIIEEYDTKTAKQPIVVLKNKHEH